MKKTILALLCSMSLFAGECSYTAKSIAVDWKAYKTPLKLGVGGSFDSVQLQTLQADSLQSLLSSAKITIDTSSINSKNRARDTKLVKFFFDIQKVDTIEASVLTLKNNIVTVAITMNNITKEIPMKQHIKDTTIFADGYLDLADFHMLPALSSINKAYYDLHKGKTWQDISIAFSLEAKETCE